MELNRSSHIFLHEVFTFRLSLRYRYKMAQNILTETPITFYLCKLWCDYFGNIFVKLSDNINILIPIIFSASVEKKLIDFNRQERKFWYL
jgi:hypothetical protein